ncbi:MAG TPA: hypothetical protein VE669_10530 [Actinomycetota bacterium]|nr:hypothetical protein [Actinomycetota bacterium]
MELGSVAAVVAIVGLWVAAVLFGRDTRDGGSWLARTNLVSRPRRLGD